MCYERQKWSQLHCYMQRGSACCMQRGSAFGRAFSFTLIRGCICGASARCRCKHADCKPLSCLLPSSLAMPLLPHGTAHHQNTVAPSAVGVDVCGRTPPTHMTPDARQLGAGKRV
jgi:hypothetical protein